MEDKRGTGLMAVLVAATILLEVSVAAAATAHVVGGSTGWTIPPNSSFYSDWASSQTVAPGDTLVFNFPTGVHDVVKVPKSSYDSCTSTSQIGSTLSTGPATVTVASGTHYYICAVTGHCSAGQKLAVTVAAAAAAAPTPAPTASSPAPAAAAPTPAPTSISPAPAAAPQAATPTASSPAPAVAPIASTPSARSPAPTADSPAPTADRKAAASPGGVAPTVPASTSVNPPIAPGPGGSGNGSNSSPGLRTAATAVVLLAAATASLLI